MEEFYCFNDKRVTPCIEPSGYRKDRRGRTQFFCRCGVCGIKKVRYVNKIETPFFVEKNDYNFIRRL